MLPDDGYCSVSQKGGAACHHLVEHRPQGVQVGSGGDLPSHGLLGRHVGHCPHHHPLGGQSGTVGGHGQAKVAYLGNPVGGEPDVPGLQVPVHYPPGVGELQAPAHGPGYLYGLFHGDTVLGRVFHQTLHVPATHEFGDHEGLPFLLAQVEHGYYVGVRTQTAHGLGFPVHSGHADIIQTLGLDQREGHLPIQHGVLGQVHFLLTAFPKEPLYLVAAVGEDRGLVGVACSFRRECWSRGRRRSGRLDSSIC